MVWYSHFSHLFKNFSQFAVSHTVKGASVIKEADVFLQLPCFLHDPWYGKFIIARLLNSHIPLTHTYTHSPSSHIFTHIPQSHTHTTHTDTQTHTRYIHTCGHTLHVAEPATPPALFILTSVSAALCPCPHPRPALPSPPSHPCPSGLNFAGR